MTDSSINWQHNKSINDKSKPAPPVPESVNNNNSSEQAQPTPSADTGNVSVRVVNGQIIIDEASLQFDRVQANQFGTLLLLYMTRRSQFLFASR